MMNKKRSPLIPPALAVMAGGSVLFAGGLLAQTFQYAAGDLVLAFRQPGNASEYAVNLGRVTQYNNLPAGTVVPVTSLSPEQLRAAFPSLNGLKWSVAAANRPPLEPNYPIQTLWISRPRLELTTQSTPWVRRSSASQGNVGSQIDGVGYNARQSGITLPAGPNNTATGVVIPVTLSFNISQVIGTSGNYANNFQGNVENVTPDDFEDDPASVSRSDLYELLPGSSATGTLNLPGRYLGYFELKPDATLTFNTATSGVTAPTITSINRDGDVITVGFHSVTGVTYRLRATDASGLTAPVSSWEVGASLVGDGNPASLRDTSASAARFYALDAQP